jgi:hypothetical protein
MGRGPRRDGGRGPGRGFPGPGGFGFDNGDDDGPSFDEDFDPGSELARFDEPAWDRD